MPIGDIFGVTFDQLFKDVIRHEGGGVTTQPLNLSLTQMEAIKDLPNLIAELKRCYKMIDQAKANLEELYEVTQSSEVQSIAHYLEGKASE